ncbi:hypothetical protein RCN72_23340 [Escherichia coli]|uniref:hypothetical protein n=1 Tax=Escherichia coli TaxID=562 RepID=UPI002E9CC774|nr:hypothetical protein [Escherichia coli]
MARQTYFTSATKRPRSLRQILAELFSGRVMSRLDELETTVRLLNERLDNQASVVANVGAIVASGSSREAKSTRPLVKEKNNKDSSNGKFSKKEAETNGLRSHYSFTGDGSRSSRPEPFDAGLQLPPLQWSVLSLWMGWRWMRYLKFIQLLRIML